MPDGKFRIAILKNDYSKISSRFRGKINDVFGFCYFMIDQVKPVMCHCFLVFLHWYRILDRLQRFFGLPCQNFVFAFQRFLDVFEFTDPASGLDQLSFHILGLMAQNVLRVGQASPQVLDLVFQQVVFSLKSVRNFKSGWVLRIPIFRTLLFVSSVKVVVL